MGEHNNNRIVVQIKKSTPKDERSELVTNAKISYSKTDIYVIYDIIQYYTILYNIIQYYTILYNIIQYI